MFWSKIFVNFLFPFKIDIKNTFCKNNLLCYLLAKTFILRKMDRIIVLF